MKKILVMTSTYPRWKNDIQPRFIELLSKELATEFELHVLCPHYQGAAVNEKSGNITVHRFRYFYDSAEKLAYDGGILSGIRNNRLKFLLIPFFLIFQSVSLFKLNQEFKFDTIHAHWIIPQGLVAVLVKIFTGEKYKILLTSHGGDLYALNNIFFRLLKTWIIKKSDHLTVVSHAMKTQCLEFGIDGKNISVYSMGVDLQKCFVKQIPYYNRDGIVFIGRLVEKKGVKFLIQALSIIQKRYPSIILTIIGDGPEYKSLVNLSEELKIGNNIVFCGSLPNQEIPARLNRAKIAVMPSIVARGGDQEGLGLVAVEAMGCGCAVIASDLPAVRDVIKNGETGILVKPESVNELATVLIQLLSDETKAEQIASRGREFVLGKFDWKIAGQNYRNLIRNLVTLPGSGYQKPLTEE